MHIASNLRALRRDQSLSQEALAKRLHLHRSSLAKYEGGVNDPPLEMVIRMSRYFKISIDAFLTVDLSKIDSHDFIGRSQEQAMIVPIQVDASGDNVIEIVPHAAQAGYSNAYADPGFIESLDQMALPFQELHGKCRAFPIDGDSMPPYASGSYIVGRHIQRPEDIVEGNRYVLLSRDEGIVFKRIKRDKKKPHVLICHSDNPRYAPFEMSLIELVEIWEFVAAISFEDASENYLATDILSRITAMQNELTQLSSQLLE